MIRQLESVRGYKSFASVGTEPRADWLFRLGTVRSRGPYVQGRVVDLARSTFARLAPPSRGVIDVRVEW